MRKKQRYASVLIGLFQTACQNTVALLKAIITIKYHNWLKKHVARMTVLSVIRTWQISCDIWRLPKMNLVQCCISTFFLPVKCIILLTICWNNKTSDPNCPTQFCGISSDFGQSQLWLQLHQLIFRWNSAGFCRIIDNTFVTFL